MAAATILKIEKSPYISIRLTDLYEILYTDSLTLLTDH